MNCPITNEGTNDRLIRIIVGFISLAAGLTVLTGLSQTIAIIIGILGLFTGLKGFCLLYRLLGISTINRRKKAD